MTYHPTTLANTSPTVSLSHFENIGLGTMVHTPRAPRSPHPAPCTTREDGASYLALKSSLHPARIHPNASRLILCNRVRPTRRTEYRWSVWASNHIKDESEDESNFLLTPSRLPSDPMGPKPRLKRHLQPIETPQRKRVKVALLTTDQGTTATPTTNGPPGQRSHLMLWIAHMVLIYVVRVRAEDWPRPSLPPAVVRAFANDVQAVMSGYKLPDRQGVREGMVVLSLWYLQRLSPKGFVDIDDLSTEDGLLAARRLLLLAFNFVSKWLVDYSSVCLERFLPYYGKGFSRSAAITLEISALEAFEHSLYITTAQFSKFRSSLAEWSSRVDMFSPFYDTHRWMAKWLRAFPSSNLATGSKGMRTLQRSCPSPFAIQKVHAALLTGLDNLLTKVPPCRLESAAPSAVRPILNFQARCCDPQPYTPSLCCPSPCPNPLYDFTCYDTSTYHNQSALIPI